MSLNFFFRFAFFCSVYMHESVHKCASLSLHFVRFSKLISFFSNKSTCDFIGLQKFIHLPLLFVSFYASRYSSICILISSLIEVIFPITTPVTILEWAWLMSDFSFDSCLFFFC